MANTSGKDGLSIGKELTIPDQLSQGHGLSWLGAHEYPSTDTLLLQTGDKLLLQSGGKILLEVA